MGATPSGLGAHTLSINIIDTKSLPSLSRNNNNNNNNAATANVSASQKNNPNPNPSRKNSTSPNANNKGSPIHNTHGDSQKEQGQGLDETAGQGRERGLLLGSVSFTGKALVTLLGAKMTRKRWVDLKKEILYVNFHAQVGDPYIIMPVDLYYIARSTHTTLTLLNFKLF